MCPLRTAWLCRPNFWVFPQKFGAAKRMGKPQERDDEFWLMCLSLISHVAPSFHAALSIHSATQLPSPHISPWARESVEKHHWNQSSASTSYGPQIPYSAAVDGTTPKWISHCWLKGHEDEHERKWRNIERCRK